MILPVRSKNFSDCRKKAGINTVVFGAGSIAQAHKSNEYVEKAQLSDGQRIIEKVIGEEQ